MLHRKGHQVPRNIVQPLLIQLAPEGLGRYMRKRHRVEMSTVYRNAGHNAAQHANGYDKNSQTGHGRNSV